MKLPRIARAAARLGLLGVGLGLAGSSGCGSEPLGVLIEGERVAVVDMHLHTGDWEGVADIAQEEIAQNLPFPINLDPDGSGDQILSPAGIVRELDKAGISRGVVLAVYAPSTVGVVTNEEVIANVEAEPERLYGLASVRVDRWAQERDEQLDALREALQRPGMIGVKLAHPHMHMRMDDPAYFGIYAVAGELGKPVYLHTGTSPFPGTSQAAPYTDPRYLEDAIAAYPDTIFILGHLGYDSVAKRHAGLEDCVRLAQTYPNVYLEASALGSKSSDPSGERLTEALVAVREGEVIDRLIYGSDGPQSPGFLGDYLQRSLAAFERAGYSLAQQRAVLSENFARVFGVEQPSL